MLQNRPSLFPFCQIGAISTLTLLLHSSNSFFGSNLTALGACVQYLVFLQLVHCNLPMFSPGCSRRDTLDMVPSFFSSLRAIQYPVKQKSKCSCSGVDVVGPSHISTLFQSIPSYWAPMKKQLVHRVGDVENDQELNERISPFYHADKIKAPLLIGQGANDPRVKQAEADQIFNAMKVCTAASIIA